MAGVISATSFFGKGRSKQLRHVTADSNDRDLTGTKAVGTQRRLAGQVTRGAHVAAPWAAGGEQPFAGTGVAWFPLDDVYVDVEQRQGCESITTVRSPRHPVSLLAGMTSCGTKAARRSVDTKTQGWDCLGLVPGR
jgi:hypothetical protein